jgi:ElaB/YqjD/DUF883 family membrane-anchored ribosome-binding protein
MPQRQCSLISFARTVGTVAGYLERAKRGDIIAEAKRLINRSPEGSMMTAAAMGLLLGAVVRSMR